MLNKGGSKDIKDKNSNMHNNKQAPNTCDRYQRDKGPLNV